MNNRNSWQIRNSRLIVWRILVFGLGLFLLGLGLWRDETAYVLKRAITICLGCIGLG